MKFLLKSGVPIFSFALLCITLLWAQESDSEPLPALPIQYLSSHVIFPGEQVQSVIDTEVNIRAYIFPVAQGDIIELRLHRTSGDLVPFLSLYTTTNENPIIEQEPQNLAGTTVSVVHEAEANEWYRVEVTYDPASESYGTFEIQLSGTTNSLYDLLDAGHPPDSEDAVFLTRGSDSSLSIENYGLFVIALDSDERFHVRVTSSVDVELELRDVSGEVLEPDEKIAEGELTYTNDLAQWVVLSVTSEHEGSFLVDISISDVEEPEATLVAYLLMDLITPSPIPTDSPTPTATATPVFTPTDTPTLTPTPIPTMTPSPTPSQCPGTLPSRLAPGDMGQVTPGSANRMRTGPGTSYNLIRTIPAGGRFEVLNGPECANNYAWYEVEYDGEIGWTAEANTQTYWLAIYDPNAPQLLMGGIGLSNGARMNNGQFQVEYYCNNQRYGVSNDNNNWYCTSNGQIVQTLTQADFDIICQQTYDRPDAFARQNGSSNIAAYRWLCYGP